MRAIRHLIALAGLATFAPTITGCQEAPPARAEWLVVVGTDALVPQFGDRLQIDVLDATGASACTGCARQLPASDASAWPISFGVPADHSDLHLRARLFRTALIGPDGSPTPPALIDRIVSLPATTTVLNVAVALPMRCFGVPADPVGHRSCDPNTGALVPEAAAPSDTASLPVVGSWPSAKAGMCSDETGTELMTCIPGGAFLMGDPTAATAELNYSVPDAPPVVDLSTLAKTPEHLVQVSSFWLDENEVTVQTYLDLKAKEASVPTLSTGKNIAEGTYCTIGGDPTMPLNCVTQPQARAICAALGKRLPTEAEWEWAAGNRASESPYPWGADVDVCGHAVLARGDALVNGATICDTGKDYPIGPVAGGMASDITASGVLNLAGNVAEWVDDDFRPYTDACWTTTTPPLEGPDCMSSASLGGSVRGGSFWDGPLFANVTTRRYQAPAAPSPLIGFRCAK